MKKIFNFLILGAFTSLISLTPQLQAAYTFKDGKLIDAKLVATLAMDEHYNAGVDAMEACNWREAARQFGIVALNFPLSPYGQEAAYYRGVAEFYAAEYDAADEAFTLYLQGKNNPRFFEETIQYKFAIAEQFRSGARRRLLGTKQLPKLGSGESHAIRIYEEVIAAVPCHELAVQSLYAKGLLHWKRNEYADAVECFQTIIKRFPKHELCPESFLVINSVYLDQCRVEFQNPDILAFAEINVRRFKMCFPREERIEEAENGILAIKEVHANGFHQTGCFYERLGRPQAAILYYRYALMQFPDTYTAGLSQYRLGLLGYQVDSKDGEDLALPAEANESTPAASPGTDIEW